MMLLSIKCFFCFISLAITSSLQIPTSIRNCNPIIGTDSYQYRYGICCNRDVRRRTFSTSLKFSKLNNHADSDNEEGSVIKTIEHQTLLSVETCINLHQHWLNDGQNWNSKIVFVDASWWHKGNLNGRKM